MADFSQLLDDVSPDVPGAGKALVLYHIKRSVIEFLTRTRLLKKTTGAFDVGANPGDITIPPAQLAADQSLLAIYNAWWLEARLFPMSPAKAQFSYGALWSSETGTPESYTQQSDDTIRLVPQPSVASALATPTGNGTPSGWSDAPALTSGFLWMSTASKTAGNVLSGSWSAPLQLEGAATLTEWSVNGSTLWHQTFATGDLYMRLNGGSALLAVGEASGGSFTDYVFQRYTPPLVLSIAYAPNETATTFPDGIFTHYRDAIAAGAKSRLMMMTKKPWTDANMAAVWEAKFDDAVGKASTKAVRGTYSASLSTAPHPF